MRMIVESYQDLLKRSPIVLDRNGAKSGLHQDAVTEVVPWYEALLKGDEIGPTPNMVNNCIGGVHLLVNI